MRGRSPVGTLTPEACYCQDGPYLADFCCVLKRQVVNGAHADQTSEEALEELLTALWVGLVHGAEMLQQKRDEARALERQWRGKGPA